MAFLQADNRGDSYYTPDWTYKILPIDWSNYQTAFEPAMGDGRLFTWLEDQGITVDGRDLEWAGETNEDEDFLHWEGEVDLIMTNPPFSKALEFMSHALPRCRTMLLLLPLNFLASLKRYPFLSENRPDALFVLSKRPSFSANGKTDSKDYAWYLWQRETKHIDPGIYFLKP